MKDLLFISQDQEIALIQQLVYKIRVSNFDIHPSKTCFLCISPDYSSIVTQHLSHALSVDGEIYHIEAVNVPFPDESPKSYMINFELSYAEWVLDWENFVLIEAGVIKGGTYSWITQIMEKFTRKNYHTVALCESTNSVFQSDVVGKYYDDNVEDLHYWWEQPNNHWPCQ